MNAPLSLLLSLLLTSYALAGEVRYTLTGELSFTALAGLMDAWDLDEFQKRAGLPGNLRFETVQDYLSEDTQLKELPENLQKEVSASPFIPEGPIGDDSWVHIVRRWRALPLDDRLPALRMSRFDPEDQAKALIWFLRAGYPMPGERSAAPEGLRTLISQFTFQSSPTGVRFSSKKEESDISSVQQTAEALLRLTKDEADLRWSIRTEGGPTTESAERYRLLQRLTTNEDTVRIVDKDTMEFFWDEAESLDGWLRLAKMSAAEAAAKLAESLTAALSAETTERWTIFADDPQTNLADLHEWMAYLAPWSNRTPEIRPLVLTLAKTIQNRIRPWKILQMGPETDVLALLDLITLTAELLPAEERKITLSHGAFPLAVQYQMTPSAEIFSHALAKLTPTNPQSRRMAIQRLDEPDAETVLPLIEEFAIQTSADPELTAALEKAKTKWNWEPVRRDIASVPLPSAPHMPTSCEVGLSSLGVNP